MTESLFHNITKLWSHFRPRRRLQIKLLLIFMIITSFAEILSIGAVLPFLGALTAPEKIFEFQLAQPIIHVLQISSPSELLLPMTILFCIAALLAGGMRWLLLWCSVKLSFRLGSDLSNEIYKRTLYQPYSVHISRNSSEIISGIWNKVSEVIFYILMPITTLINSGILVICLSIALFTIIPNIAMVSMGILVVIYAIFFKLTRRKLELNSKYIAIESNNVLKTLQEGLSGIRDVLLNGSQEVFCESYERTNNILRRAQGNNQIIGQTPRFTLEAMGMILIALLAYFLSQDAGGLSVALPNLAALALGLQRLLPNTQLLYGSWSTIKGSQASLIDVVKLLEQPLLEDKEENHNYSFVTFKSNIQLSQISFRYNDDSKWILQNIDLKIDRGSRIGFIGTTGCGKTTLLDMIMGLLDPSNGAMMVDGIPINSINCRAWQNKIAHVPQSVFLADSTIESNIAFGVSEELIDRERLIRAAKQAQLADLIEGWPDKYKTRVGERGVQLSGGQCQRIGIARALYKEAELIVLDEATSALDGETEDAVMKAIESLNSDLTLLIIAHRLNTLKYCDAIYEIRNGSIIKK